MKIVFHLFFIYFHLFWDFCMWQTFVVSTYHQNLDESFYAWGIGLASNSRCSVNLVRSAPSTLEDLAWRLGDIFVPSNLSFMIYLAMADSMFLLLF
jgi:hypothetical protein